MVETALERLMAAGTLLRGEFRPDGVEREWCDPEVLRLLRRRSLARLRREIEPVEPRALGRFLSAWQGVGSAAGGLDRLAEVIAQLEGLPLPASVLERDILPARVRGYSPRLLDELGAAGEVAWVGMGSLGRDDGRIALYRPDRLAMLLPASSGVPARASDQTGSPAQPAVPSEPTAPAGSAGLADSSEDAPEWLRDALRTQLEERGASFYRDLLAAALRAAATRGTRLPTERELLDALWDLVWAGVVTNDTFAALRALRWPRSGRSRGAARPRIGASGRMGPPDAAGRWSLVSDMVTTSIALAGGREPSETERRHALAMSLLERQGIVTRDGVVAEGIAGGFGAVYTVLREMEERGRVRRGYFVEGLGGAQFALPGAVDRLRSERSDPGGERPPEARTLLLAAADPANPYGASLPWPRHGDDDRRVLARAAGAYVVLHDGEPVLYLERGGRSLQTLPAFTVGDAADAALHALADLATDGRLRSLRIERLDGVPISGSPHRERLAGAGFRASYRGYVVGRS